MQTLLIGVGLGIFGAVLIWLRRSRTASTPATMESVSELDRKLHFIRDVCDGNLNKSNALLNEKIAADSSLSYEQAVDLVYADMLELTNEERTALERYANRRAA